MSPSEAPEGSGAHGLLFTRFGTVLLVLFLLCIVAAFFYDVTIMTFAPRLEE